MQKEEGWGVEGELGGEGTDKLITEITLISEVLVILNLMYSN